MDRTVLKWRYSKRNALVADDIKRDIWEVVPLYNVDNLIDPNLSKKKFKVHVTTAQIFLKIIF